VKVLVERESSLIERGILNVCCPPYNHDNSASLKMCTSSMLLCYQLTAKSRSHHARTPCRISMAGHAELRCILLLSTRIGDRCSCKQDACNNMVHKVQRLTITHMSHVQPVDVYAPHTGGYNDVRVEENACGCLYALDLDPVTYTVVNMYGESVPTPNYKLQLPHTNFKHTALITASCRPPFPLHPATQRNK
jgi:hypothetical protein